MSDAYHDLVTAFVAGAMEAHANSLEGFVRNGCCVCGDVVTTIRQQPTWDLELVHGAPSILGGGPSLRVTGEYRVLCAVHAESEAPATSGDEPK